MSKGAKEQRTGDPHTSQMQDIGRFLFRYGLALIFVWIGLLKFSEYDPRGIEPFVTNSPIFASSLATIGLRSLSNMISLLEIAVGRSGAKACFPA